MEEQWTQISFTLLPPHEAMLIGYECVVPDEEQDWYTFSLHCLIITFRYEWGFGDSPYK